MVFSAYNPYRQIANGAERPQMHDFKHISEFITSGFGETLWPTRCIGCDIPGTLLCPDCREKLPLIDTRLACPYCGSPFGKFNCTECGSLLCATQKEADELLVHSGDRPRIETLRPYFPTRAALVYAGIGKRLITAYKDGGEQRLDALIATLMLEAIRGEIVTGARVPRCFGAVRVADLSQWADAIVPIPASKAAYARRGFDHMGRISKLLGTWTGLPVLDALVQRQHVGDQRTLTRAERASNRAGSFAVAPDASLPPHVLLIDDVLTTGATTVAASEALLAGGSTHIAVTVCARVW